MRHLAIQTDKVYSHQKSGNSFVHVLIYFLNLRQLDCAQNSKPFSSV